MSWIDSLKTWATTPVKVTTYTWSEAWDADQYLGKTGVGGYIFDTTKEAAQAVQELPAQIKSTIDTTLNKVSSGLASGTVTGLFAAAVAGYLIYKVTKKL